jgi:peptidoglycan/LPS O-acetylase OafA/YrhL
MKRGFDGIQGLRALAALAVALLHVADEAGSLVGTPGLAPWRVIDAVPLEAGVDLFFVISGFVMVWSSWDAFGRAGSVAPFVWRRLVRIAPLYWLLTAATVLAALALPGLLSDGLRDGWGYAAASFAFVPWRRSDGFIQPILRLGWTLEYEMLFYALMACALPFRRIWGIAGVLVAIAVLAGLGQWVPFAAAPAVFWTDPIVLEFGFGVLVALAARRGARAGWAGPLALLVAIGLALLLASQPGGDIRVVVWGIPAALLVFCALSWQRVPRWLVVLGDASYALYLVHPFPMRAIRVAVAHLPLPPGLVVPLYLLCTMAVCIAIAIALYWLVEKPILRWGRRVSSIQDDTVRV